MRGESRLGVNAVACGAACTLLLFAHACGGQKVTQCMSGETLCGQSCVALSNDPSNCGACGNLCADGTSCDLGTCATNCGPGTVQCGQSCVDLKVDRANCGACAAKCSSGEACVSGGCASSCVSGQTLCTLDGGAAYCANTQSDNANCGACGATCESGFACLAGACQRSCLAGQTACGDACVDTGNDRLNCGACGVMCVGACVNGVCENIETLAAGSHHTCALMSSKTVWCWGENANGEVGDGTLQPRSSPVEVIGLHGISQLVAGDRFTCALDGASFQPLCFGLNDRGELGVGDTIDRTAPTAASIYNVSQLMSGPMSEHACTFGLYGVSDCWGANGEGQLEDGTTTDRHSPIQNTLGGAGLALGALHTCEVVSGAGSSVECVGVNNVGQLGDGGQEFNSLTLVSVSGITNALAVEAGSVHTCAVLADGTAVCWGYNASGQLGDGSTTTRTTPVAVTGLTSLPINQVGWMHVLATGGNHTCAIRSTGDLDCWGDNTFGQLGDGTMVNKATPTVVTGLTQSVVQVAAGAGHTCALLADRKSVMCWGAGDSGQLGNGTTSGSPKPVEVQ